MKVTQNKKRIHKLIFGRTLIVVVLILLQIFMLIVPFIAFKEYIAYFYIFYSVISLFIIVDLVNDDRNPLFKIAWMIPVAIVPIFGTLFYVYFDRQTETVRLAKKYAGSVDKTRVYLDQDEDVYEQLIKEDRTVASVAKYMSDYGEYPIYNNSKAYYIASGEEKFEIMKKLLINAKRYIFLEYYIIEYGQMWDEILDILTKKAAEGVEVRIIYDGMCTISALPYHYPKQLEKLGIKCKIFSPIKPALSTHQNNRDHRKILVVDGAAAITGGINIADNYINLTHKYGHWKDSSVLVNGDAVRTFSMLFLQMWNVKAKEDEDYDKYSDTIPIKGSEGYILPFGDSPFDDENVGEAMYLDIINQAVEYVHIMTPYLVLDNELSMALTHAAKRGVDVTILLPHINDNPVSAKVAQTYYVELITKGVKIYEYTPGFVHSKVMISDSIKAIVGTINLDCRSLYLNFECAVYSYKSGYEISVEEDFKKAILVSEQMSVIKYKKLGHINRIVGRIMRIFAPLF